MIQLCDEQQVLTEGHRSDEKHNCKIFMQIQENEMYVLRSPRK